MSRRAEELFAEGIPVQAVEDPILCNPYEEPKRHWVYQKGKPYIYEGRRPASYWVKAERGAEAQAELYAEENSEELYLVERLRKDVGRWRESGYRGASNVTRDLLRHWSSGDRARRLFFCQLEAVETLIYLLEIRLPGRAGRTLFKEFEVSEDDLKRLLHGERPSWAQEKDRLTQRLIDPPADLDLLPLVRLGCKMATGSGKTIVMAMMITWAFCNRGQNPASREFPNAVLVCCPNLTVKERLQVLRPEDPANYYDEFDVVPGKYRHFVNAGKVLVTNWHFLALKSEHREGESSFKVVEKGEETNDAFALDRLGELAQRLPILVLNDEGHHCWRPNPEGSDGKQAKKPSAEEKETLEKEREEARVWLEGLDRINNAGLLGKETRCIHAAIDLSATPFYLGASGYMEGSPFPWLVNDFGLVDAIESGIVKIPRLPVMDDTGATDDAGRPDPKYFRLWRHINEAIPDKERSQNGRPKPGPVFREAEGALRTLAAQWKGRYDQEKAAQPTQLAIPPVLIVVCDNTEIAEVFFRKLSGERKEEVVNPDTRKAEEKTIYDGSAILPEFSNTESEQRTVRIDTKMLDKLEVEEGSTRDKAAEALREVIATVGKKGKPGEHVRCVVSVGMLTEGWDASNVTHILGVRAFGSQLLCEQVVGRGLRRRNYKPDPATGRLEAEYVDVYGIPFSLIPFKGRTGTSPRGEDQPRPHFYALPERKAFEIRLPSVESYVYALRSGTIFCEVGKLEGFHVEEEPTEVFVAPVRGIQDDPSAGPPEEFVRQDRRSFYESIHFQTLLLDLARRVVDRLVAGQNADEEGRAVKNLESRHQLFPQVHRIVREYVDRKITFGDGVDKRELGLQKYAELLVQRIADNITPAAAAADAPLLPVLNSFRPYESTAGVDYSTVRPVVPLVKSHLNAAAIQSSWEKAAIRILEESPDVAFFAPNDSKIGLRIPYDYGEGSHVYIPDFVVRLKDGKTLLLEIKGRAGEMHEPDRILAKNTAARKWATAVSNLGTFGKWEFEICRELAILPARLRQLATAEPGKVVPLRRLPFEVKENPGELDRYKTCVPLVPLRLVASAFQGEETAGSRPLDEADEWAVLPEGTRIADGMFVAQVHGDSMNQKIPDGSWCLFRTPPQGSRAGKVVLVKHEGVIDPVYGGQYSVKQYTSEKVHDEDGGFRHTKITLRPLSDNLSHEPIVLTPEDEGQVAVVAEFVSVLEPRPEVAS